MLHFVKTLHSEERRLEGQVAAKRAKDDKKAADKIEKRRLAMEAIRRSRTNQIELRKEKKASRVKTDKEFSAQWRVQQKTIEEEEEEERIKMRKMHLGHQKYLRRQIKVQSLPLSPLFSPLIYTPPHYWRLAYSCHQVQSLSLSRLFSYIIFSPLLPHHTGDLPTVVTR